MSFFKRTEYWHTGGYNDPPSWCAREGIRGFGIDSTRFLDALGITCDDSKAPHIMYLPPGIPTASSNRPGLRLNRKQLRWQIQKQIRLNR